MRIGSLFSGYGGLELGVQSVLAGTVAWHCDNDPGASRILAHHWPATPNLGDITTVDWAQVEPVDVLTGGFPCQDVSHAGKRLGLHPDTRTGLWSHMAYAIEKLRPRMVVAENVRGLLSAEAAGDLEPCPWCLGDDGPRPLRALGAVLGDLADLGYDMRWCGLRAADVGAPHGRFRVFVVATDADHQRPVPPRTYRQGSAVAEGVSEPAPHPDLATSSERRQPAPGQAEGGRSRANAGRRGGAPTTDTGGQRHGGGQDTRGAGRVDREDAGGSRQRERARSVSVGGGAAAAPDAEVHEQREQTVPRPLRHEPRDGAGRVEWGQYAPAIARWEHVIGRSAPPPTEWTGKANPRLSPTFVEWMMGLPEGHVTAVPGLTRNAQLKALGNGVVPQQIAAALRILLGGEALAVSSDADLLPTPSVADGMGGHLSRSGARSGELLLPGVAKAMSSWMSS